MQARQYYFLDQNLEWAAGFHRAMSLRRKMGTYFPAQLLWLGDGVDI